MAFFSKTLIAKLISSQLLRIIHKTRQSLHDILRLNNKTPKNTLVALFESGTFENE